MRKLLVLAVCIWLIAATGFAAPKGVIPRNPARANLVPSLPPTLSGPCLSYDDGSFENGYASGNPGDGFATWFTAPAYPFTVEDIEYMIYPGWPDPDHEQIEIEVWDCATRTVIYSVTEVPTAFGPDWNVHVIPSPLTVNADFLVAITQKTMFFDCEALAVDENLPYMNRDQYRFAGDPWYPGCFAGGAGFGDWMLRVNCQPLSGVSCQMVLYQSMVPKSATLDLCQEWTNHDSVSHDITGRLEFRDGNGVLRLTVPYPAFTIGPSAALHRLFALSVPASAPEGDYTVENVGTYDGIEFRCGPETLTVLPDPSAGYVPGSCP